VAVWRCDSSCSAALRPGRRRPVRDAFPLLAVPLCEGPRSGATEPEERVSDSDMFARGIVCSTDRRGGRVGSCSLTASNTMCVNDVRVSLCSCELTDGRSSVFQQATWGLSSLLRRHNVFLLIRTSSSRVRRRRRFLLSSGIRRLSSFPVKGV